MANIFRLGGSNAVVKLEIIKNGIKQSGYDFTASTGTITWDSNGLNYSLSGNTTRYLTINNPISIPSDKKTFLTIEIDKQASTEQYGYSYFNIEGMENKYNLNILATEARTTGFETLTIELKNLSQFTQFRLNNANGDYKVIIKNMRFEIM